MNQPARHSTRNPAKRIRIRGLVQGVGFRPMVWRLARQWHLSGRVLNDGAGVLVEARGNDIEGFIASIPQHCPPLARIDSIEHDTAADILIPDDDFIIDSSEQSQVQTGIVPDAATCPACLADIRDPSNRRYQYPFTNCTHCGPRLSIVRAIPYDRAYTSMADFPLCPDCRQEYENPADRRFHAQPNACPECGPRLWLQDQQGVLNDEPIAAAASRIRNGEILAVKGIGGFHLVCDARNAAAVSRLRTRKKRPAKAFALMARDLAQIEQYAILNRSESELLQSMEAPVVLLQARADCDLPAAIAPGLNTLGFMLPTSPLHHLLMDAVNGPIIATSGNLGGLPPCIDNQQALERLADVADAMLLHNRPILNRIDDSVMRVADHRVEMFRRARGYAPASISLPAGFETAPEILAFGGELKNSFCLITAAKAVVSQHMGDLENLQTYEDYCHNLQLYQQLFQHQPELLAVDHHPEYLSTKLAEEMATSENLPLLAVQHHHAHIASCLADNHWPLQGGKVIGIALDGIGFGDDDALWGGEILVADYCGYERVAQLAAISLPGAAQAMRQPWRNLLAQLWHSFGEHWDSQLGRHLPCLKNASVAPVLRMIQGQINSPLASSTGRLFDAVAAALGICSEGIHYEGQAALELESLTDLEQCQAQRSHAYPLQFRQSHNRPAIIDPAALWPPLLTDLHRGEQAAVISARFHAGLAQAFAQAALHYAEPYQIRHIALSGGVLHNRLLRQLLITDLQAVGLQVFTHHQVPANDGGLSLGQAVVAAAQYITGESSQCA